MIKPKKLDSRGIAHHFALAVIVVGLAVFGVYELVASHADSNLPYTLVSSKQLPPGVTIKGDCVYYKGTCFGSTGTPVFTQHQWDVLSPSAKAKLGAVTITLPQFANVAGGRDYTSGNNQGTNTSGLVVEGNTVVYDGHPIGPTGVPFYTQSQLDNQKPKPASYQIVGDAYASIAHGQVYTANMGGYDSNGAPISKAQYQTDVAAIKKVFGSMNDYAYNCLSNMETAQISAARAEIVSSFDPSTCTGAPKPKTSSAQPPKTSSGQSTPTIAYKIPTLDVTAVPKSNRVSLAWHSNSKTNSKANNANGWTLVWSTGNTLVGGKTFSWSGGTVGTSLTLKCGTTYLFSVVSTYNGKADSPAAQSTAKVNCAGS